MNRRQLLDTLIVRGAELRPHLLWQDVYSPVTHDVLETAEKSKTHIITAEGATGVQTNSDMQDILVQKNYPANISESIYFVHSSEVVRERTDQQVGIYFVNLWVEAYTKDEFREIERVAYRLHDTFNQRVISTEAKDKSFLISLTVYGEFTVIGLINRKNKDALWITRYIDLPGRPPE